MQVAVSGKTKVCEPYILNKNISRTHKKLYISYYPGGSASLTLLKPDDVCKNGYAHI